MTYKIHTIETAPEEAKAQLEQVQKKYGFIPNLFGIMAEAPSVIQAYLTLSKMLDDTSLTATERQIALLTTSYFNNCAYCMAAHSTVATMQNIPQEIIQALRSSSPIDDPKLEALRLFTLDVTEKRGYPSEETLKNFLDAGYSQAQVLEIILCVTFKTLSNYVNHVAETPLDAAFKKQEWHK